MKRKDMLRHVTEAQLQSFIVQEFNNLGQLLIAHGHYNLAVELRQIGPTWLYTTPLDLDLDTDTDTEH